MANAIASRVTPPREPAADTTPETWFESVLCQIIGHAILMPGKPPVTEYLIRAMDWALAQRKRIMAEPDPNAYDDWREAAFEEWVIERWSSEIRQPAFRASADFHYLRAEWEREQ